MADFSRDRSEQLRRQLQEAVVKCSERCLYQSAKWYLCVLVQVTGCDLITRQGRRAFQLASHIGRLRSRLSNARCRLIIFNAYLPLLEP